MTDYAALLKKNDLKATFQRTTILEAIEKRGHMSVEAIYEEVVKVHASISLATIYKNISQMLESGIVLEVPVVGQKPQYELKKEDHIHLVCTSCGSVVDEYVDTICDEKLTLAAAKDSFQLSRSQINLYGLCKNCQS